MELLSKVHTGEGPGGQGRLTRAAGGESYQELTFAFDFLGCHLGHVLTGGASVSPRLLQAAWPHK